MNDCSRSVQRASRASKAGRHLALAISLLVGSAVVTAQPDPYDKAKYPFLITHDVLKFFYPEVFGKDWQVTFIAGQPIDSSPWGEFPTGFQFKVTRFSHERSCRPQMLPNPGTVIPPAETITCLEGQTWIGPRGEVLELFVDGELANAKENELITKLVESHREWSEEQAERALKEAGALYGPADRDDFLKSLDLPDLEKTLGFRIASAEHLKRSWGSAMPSVEFGGWSNPEHEGNFAGLRWDVRMEVPLPDGSVREYALGFEPFKGKLIVIVQAPPHNGRFF